MVNAQSSENTLSPEEQLLKKHNGNIEAAIESLKKTSSSSRATARKTNPRRSDEIVAKLQNVNKTYNKGKSNQFKALSNINIEIYKEEIVAIVGSSGSGKSTLLNLIGGLDTPDSGEIVIADKELSGLSDSQLSIFRNRTVGFVFQFFYLQPFLTLEKNIQIPLFFKKNFDKSKVAELSDELISLVGLEDRKKHLPKELSGGQMQRAAIARALINRPQLVIADEPTGNLDSKNTEAVLELFEGIRSKYGSSVIVVTHDQKVAERADRIINLEDGEIQNV